MYSLTPSSCLPLTVRLGVVQEALPLNGHFPDSLFIFLFCSFHQVPSLTTTIHLPTKSPSAHPTKPAISVLFSQPASTSLHHSAFKPTSYPASQEPRPVKSLGQTADISQTRFLIISFIQFSSPLDGELIRACEGKRPTEDFTDLTSTQPGQEHDDKTRKEDRRRKEERKNFSLVCLCIEMCMDVWQSFLHGFFFTSLFRDKKCMVEIMRIRTDVERKEEKI